MDLNPTEIKKNTPQQKAALKKITTAENAFQDTMKEISNNLLVNGDAFKRAQDHMQMAGMLYRRGVSKPNER
jgi:hypothetical protein